MPNVEIFTAFTEEKINDRSLQAINPIIKNKGYTSMDVLSDFLMSCKIQLQSKTNAVLINRKPVKITSFRADENFNLLLVITKVDDFFVIISMGKCIYKYIDAGQMVEECELDW